MSDKNYTPTYAKSFDDYVNLYDFYGTPDGENCLEKTYYFTKYSAIAGAVVSVYEMALLSRPTTIRAGIARFGRFTLPFAATGFVFGSALCILGQMRKKDDLANHIIAGMAAGATWGFKYNRLYNGHLMALYLGFFAGYFRFFNVYKIPLVVPRTDAQTKHQPGLDFTIKLYDDPGRSNY